MDRLQASISKQGGFLSRIVNLTEMTTKGHRPSLYMYRSQSESPPYPTIRVTILQKSASSCLCNPPQCCTAGSDVVVAALRPHPRTMSRPIRLAEYLTLSICSQLHSHGYIYFRHCASTLASSWYRCTYWAGNL